jgi:uncharacterized protein (DUF983 family)
MFKESTEIRATSFEVRCPHCEKWDDWGSCDPSGSSGECQSCGEPYTVHPDADIESYQ